MRISPDGTAVAYTLGYAGGPLHVQVIDVRTGGVLITLPAGHDPRWIDTGAHTLIARSPDGAESLSLDGPYTCRYVGANHGDLDAAGGLRAAYTPDRAVGLTAYAYAGTHPEINYPRTFEAGLSAGGTLALRDLDSGIMRLERLPGCTDAPAGTPTIGPHTRPRWSSQSIVFDSIPYGRVFGRSSPDQPSIDLTVPDRQCSHPVIVWTGRLLLVGMVLDDGLLIVAEWGSLTRHEGVGWIVATSTGSAFDWDIGRDPDLPDLISIAFLTPAGTLGLVSLDTRHPVESLLPDTPPPDPPDPEPPDPEPPDPPDPEPPPEGDMISIDEACARAGYPAPADIVEGALNRFRNEVILDRDKIDPDSMTMGALRYFFQYYGPDMAEQQVRGGVPGSADAWGNYSYHAFSEAAAAYTREQNPPPTPEPPEPGALQGPIGVDGSTFTVPG